VNAIQLESGGAKLQNYRYPVQVGQQRKGIIFFVHGYGCNTTNHAYLAQIFAQNGYEFCGIDQRGFGLSEGIRGRVENMSSVINDLNKFNEEYCK
jgi:alpha-beta hydrolase superfamily lysophospholipase